MLPNKSRRPSPGMAGATKCETKGSGLAFKVTGSTAELIAALLLQNTLVLLALLVSLGVNR